MHLFPKTGAYKAIKIRTANMKVYFIIPPNYRLTGHPENFKIKYVIFKKD